jgi:adenine C2-methylase RlmN of 23S rRNA A2503 and tRNA A37
LSREDNVKNIIERYEKESKFIRKQVYNLTLYSEGVYKTSDMWIMPLSMIKELDEALAEKNEKIKEAMNKSKGISTTMF